MSVTDRNRALRAIELSSWASVLALVLSMASVATQADDIRTAGATQSSAEHVASSLEALTDAQVASRARADFASARERDPSESVAGADAADDAAQVTLHEARATTASRAAIEHTRVFLAIRDGARNGALVQ
jgi:hypothetical protein